MATLNLRALHASILTTAFIPARKPSHGCKRRRRPTFGSFRVSQVDRGLLVPFGVPHRAELGRFDDAWRYIDEATTAVETESGRQFKSKIGPTTPAQAHVQPIGTPNKQVTCQSFCATSARFNSGKRDRPRAVSP
jgi:hypothetical protein